MRTVLASTLVIAAAASAALTSSGSGPGVEAGQTPGAVSIDAQFRYTCVVMEEGPPQCWGENAQGALGDGTEVDRNGPVYVAGVSDDIIDVATADAHTCALNSAGAVQCWGGNGDGELGDGTGVSSLTPVNVQGLQSGIADIESGELHSCAVLQSGGVKCWGANWSGQLGDGTIDDRTAPVDVENIQDAKLVSGGEDDFTCVLRESGGVYCWGANDEGQLGAGLTDDYKPMPVAVNGLGSGVKAIAAGGDHACAVKANGHVACWGRNASGQLGNGATSQQDTPVEVQGLANAASVAAGHNHTCAVTTAGAVKCWGSNAVGQLGDGSTTERHQPVQVNGLASGVKQVAAGSAHTCALLDNGTVKCWGYNNLGQLGDGTNNQSLEPLNVELLPPPATPTPTPTGGAQLIQGDVDCSGSVNSVDALKVLRFVAQLSVAQPLGCPLIGTLAPLFGDVDCSVGVNSVDALKILRYVAQLTVIQNDPCVDIGNSLN